MRRQHLHRHQSTPGDNAGEFGLVLTEQAGAHRRADTVGTERERAGGNPAVVKSHSDAAAILRQVREAAAEPDRVRSLTPDRFGSYLTAAWSAVRAAHFFWPWFDVKAAHAIAFTAEEVDPDVLALEHRSLIRARAGRALLNTLVEIDRDALVKNAPGIVEWKKASWAKARNDIWSPEGH